MRNSKIPFRRIVNYIHCNISGLEDTALRQQLSQLWLVSHFVLVSRGVRVRRVGHRHIYAIGADLHLQRLSEAAQGPFGRRVCAVPIDGTVGDLRRNEDDPAAPIALHPPKYCACSVNRPQYIYLQKSFESALGYLVKLPEINIDWLHHIPVY